MSDPAALSTRLEYGYTVHQEEEFSTILETRGLPSHLLGLNRRNDGGRSPNTDLRALRGPDGSFSDGLHLSGLYWPTPIVGSGLVTFSGQAIAELKKKILSLSEALHQLSQDVKDRVPERLADGTSLQSVTRQFLLGMMNDRLGESEVPDLPMLGADSHPDDESCTCALIAALTALLTECFQRAQGVTLAPVWGERDDVAQMQQLPALDRAEFKTNLLDPAADILQVLGLRNVDKPLKRLLDEIWSDLGREEVPARSLQRLTEYLWWKLTEGLVGYSPGWKALLFSLSIRAGFLPVHRRESARPFIVDSEDIEDSIRSIFKESLQSHWSEPSEGHAAVAALLISLVRFREGWTHTKQQQLQTDASPSSTVGDRQPTQGSEEPKALPADWPMASAFTASFDLELEKALWKAGHQFAVLIPAIVTYRYNGHERLRHWTWLGRVIDPTMRNPRMDPADEISCITQPGIGSEWFAVGDRANFDPTFVEHDRPLGFADPSAQCDAAKLPLIVRLTGCPAFQLPPSLDQSKSAQDRSGLGARQGWMPYHENVLDLHPADRPKTGWVATWSHDVLVDDFSVSRRIGVEDDPKTDGDLVDSSLPFSVAAPTTLVGEMRRTWLAAGLPLGDSAIRTRVASLVAGKTAERGTGILVNTSIGVAECDLLSWYGFEFYCAEASQFTSGMQQVREAFDGNA